MEKLMEYPRPQLVRDSYINLNGLWMVCIKNKDNELKYSDYINVPYSPEAYSSGIKKTLLPNEELWYKKDIVLDIEDDEDVILNFGAVDQICELYINGQYYYSHVGGYTPFSVNITNLIKSKNISIELKVKDYTELSELSRGKQSLKPKGIWYPAQSGIWQTVWIEKVPKNHISNIKITPNVDSSSVTIRVNANVDKVCTIKIDDETFLVPTNKDNVIKISNPKLWSPENPYLYHVEIVMDKDKVKSYFGMRKIEIKKINKIPYVCLNNKPIFLNGILEQGYYGNDLYTPASYETIENDIKTIKSCGFNTIRKHIKLEPELYYYYCDKEGILVIQDMINGGGKYNLAVIGSPFFFDIPLTDNHYKLFSRRNNDAKLHFEEEVKTIMQDLYNHPSVIMYTLFNEAWGQYDTKRIYDMMNSVDDTRLIDPNSGWYDQGVGSLASKHRYIQKYRYKPDKLGRATILSEYGGYSVGNEFFFYGHARNEVEYLKLIKKTIDDQIKPHIDNGLVGAIYTQYNDIETENNGIVNKKRELKADLKNAFKL